MFIPNQPWRLVVQELLTAGHVGTNNQPLALQIEGDLLIPLRPDSHGSFSPKRASWRDLNSHWASVTQGLHPGQLSSLRSFFEQASHNGTVSWRQLTPSASAALRTCIETGVSLFNGASRNQIWVNKDTPPCYLHYTELPGEAGSETRLRVSRESWRTGDHDETPLPGYVVAQYRPTALLRLLETYFVSGWKASLLPADSLEFWGKWAPRLASLQILGSDSLHVAGHGQAGPVFSAARLCGLLRIHPQSTRQLEIAWSVERSTAEGQVLSLPLEPGILDQEIRYLQQQIIAISKLSEGQTEQFFQQHFPIWEIAAVRQLVAKINDSGYAVITEAPGLSQLKFYSHGPEISLQLEKDQQAGFNLQLGLRVGHEDLSPQDFFSLLGSREGWWKSPAGNWVDSSASRVAELHDIIAEFRALGLPEFQTGFTQVGLSHLALVQALERISVTTQINADWRDAVAKLVNPPVFAVPDLPAGYAWRPYQKQGFRWLKSRAVAGLGGILADEMGLGKTVQVLSLVQSLQDDLVSEAPDATDRKNTAPVFVVVPASLLGTWQEQAAQWFGQLRLAVYSSGIGKTAYDRNRALRQVSAADIVLTTYTLARIDRDFWATVDFSGLILDEAQAVKNPDTATHRALRSLQAPWCFALTGTPIENSPTDLWALMALAMPGLLPNRPIFEKRFMQNNTLSQQQLAHQRLGKIVAPFLLRRTKSGVAKELPEKIEQSIHLQMLPQQANLYRKYLLAARTQAADEDSLWRSPAASTTVKKTGVSAPINILAALTRLRQLALSGRLLDPQLSEDGAKIDYLVAALCEIIQDGHQSLVFSQFTSFLALLRNALEQAGIPYAYLDGATRNRYAQVQAFQEQQASVFLISLKAGGFGLNLTAADYVFLCDPWWNPAVENQAVDRAHRLGQDKTVNVYRLIAADTIEEHVLELQEHKRKLIAQVLSGSENTNSGSVFTGISLSELRALLEA